MNIYNLITKLKSSKKIVIRIDGKDYDISEFTMDDVGSIGSYNTYSKTELATCYISFSEIEKKLSAEDLFDEITDYYENCCDVCFGDNLEDESLKIGLEDEDIFIRFGLFDYYDFEIIEEEDSIILKGSGILV
jgi:hypothetical protein